MIGEVTIRFRDTFEKLLSDGRVGDQKEFAKAIGISTSMMTEIIKGRSNVGLSAIQNTVLIYDIDAKWLLTGKAPCEPVVSNNKDALEMIRDLAAENAILKQENEKLKRGDYPAARGAGYAAAG